MSEKSEKSSEKGILARTATYTTKKARRAQTKLKQKVGKGDETKDEVFDEFVNNFNRQQAAAARLHSELKNYLRCITAMQLAASNFAEAFKEVYEEDWTCRDKVCGLFKESDSNWTNLSKCLTEEVLEPLTSYQKPFVDVKNKIQKRSRKLVDYDHTRHTVDTLRAKGATKSSDAKKLNQAEEDYQKARDIFVDLTSDLYEELPALYDSRIGFYVSCFQSIFTLEEVFHREAARIEHQLNDLMDQLIEDFSAGTYSTRKPFSAGLETSSTASCEKVDKENENGGLAQFYDVAVPEDQHDQSIDSVDSGLSKQSADQSSNERYENLVEEPSPSLLQPSRPAPVPSSKGLSPSNSIDKPNGAHLDTTDSGDDRAIDLRNVKKELAEKLSKKEDINQNGSTQEEPQTPVTEAEPTKEPEADATSNVVAYKNIPAPDNPNPCNLIVPSSLYRVIATHKYTAEDEDELSFEKGEIIHVIPFDNPEEQDEGWLMGVIDSSGMTGVFPENFSKKHT